MKAERREKLLDEIEDAIRDIPTEQDLEEVLSYVKSMGGNAKREL